MMMMMMMLLRLFFVIFVILSVFADEYGNIDENSSETSIEELRESNKEWKKEALHQDEWIARDDFKRQRFRTRKRRPPIYSDDEEELIPRRRPQHADLWEEMMNDDDEQKPYIRRRLPPVYHESDEDEFETPKLILKEQVRDPYTALLEAEEKQQRKTIEETTTTTTIPELKLLLKQKGTLSLSEILQQKNLSLSELLKGNQQAISALTERSDVTSTEDIVEIFSSTTETSKYNRLPPSVGLRKNINRNYEQSSESDESPLTSRELLEAQRKRLSLLHSHKENKLFADVTKFDVVTEHSTDRRIFVPSSPKYTTVDFMPELHQSEELNSDEFAQFSTLPPSTTTRISKFVRNKDDRMPLFKPKPKTNLPVTSAKLSKFSNRPTVPPKAIKIDINEVFGFKTENDEPNGPLKMSINLDVDNMKPIEENTPKWKPTVTEVISPEKFKYVSKWRTSTERPHEHKFKLNSHTTTEMPLFEKLKNVNAKDEIMEILSDPIGREKLSRILQTRNMTIEELVEQRERGSSQLHLADIFHNKTLEPEPKDAPLIGKMPTDYFNSFPSFNRQSKSRQFDPKLDSVTEKPKETVTVTSFPTFKIEIDKNPTENQPFLPIWKELYPSIFQDIYESNNQKPVEIQMTTESAFQRPEELENHLSLSANDDFHLDSHYNHVVIDENDLVSLPAGVKSAIIASFAIIGLSLFVFLTILVVFKWNQKQKQRLCYRGSFSGSKIKSPILETAQRRSLRSLMTETLGRKKNYYKSHIQTLPDNIWHTEKKNYM